ncbi:hypothetical protein PNBC_05905 [Paenibacillus crassostreae]|uniref:Uncharacterized protein n=2 Tax=Paenibacillus crassostreae TaxID=1763538 RepID=A0A167FUY1_9BACL|nr:hypothetical protein LPB68_18830 [Paenibacillus crassostreae]OAB76928.1 hypothetical protein PNBC_05905 [Paenibacillus crassostreae]
MAWAALFKKDFRLTRTIFLVGLVINFLVLLLSLYLVMRMGDSFFIFAPLLIIILFHIFYFPIMLFISLKTEANQMHLFLHNPQSATTLLLSKVLNGLIMMVVSLVVLYMMASLLIIPRFNLIEQYWTDTWISGLLIFVHIMIVSMQIGVLVLFLWSLYHSIKHRIGRWSWLALLGAVIIKFRIDAYFVSFNLTQWGDLRMSFPTFQIEPIQVYVGEYLYHFMCFIGLFYLSVWLVDRKVEK